MAVRSPLGERLIALSDAGHARGEELRAAADRLNDVVNRSFRAEFQPVGVYLKAFYATRDLWLECVGKAA